MQAAGGACGELHRDALDVGGGKAGDAVGPLGRVLAQGGGELVEADRVFGHVLLVVQAAVDEHVAHGQHQRQVGARVDGQPLVGEAMELFRRGSISTIYAPFSWAFSRACSWLGRMASA